MALNLKDCFDKRLLKKMPPSREKAKRNLEAAKKFLEDAQANYNEKRFESSMMLAYTAAFNAVKSLLTSEGVSEASHICTILYLNDRHPELVELVETLDAFRSRRHGIQYSATTTTPEEAGEYLTFTRKLIEEINNKL
jgi:uncharacterized protein (UPF0332 family)